MAMMLTNMCAKMHCHDVRVSLHRSQGKHACSTIRDTLISQLTCERLAEQQVPIVAIQRRRRHCISEKWTRPERG